jgi:hypothetical protein
MGEIDEVDDAVHHGIAQGYQGVHAAENQTVDDLLQQDVHNENPFFCVDALERRPADPGALVGTLGLLSKKPASM